MAVVMTPASQKPTQAQIQATHTHSPLLLFAVKLCEVYIDCNWLYRQWWTTHWLEFNNLLINNIEENILWNWKAYDKIANSNNIKSIMGFNPLHVYNFFFRFIIQLELKSVWNFFCNKSLLPPVFFYSFVRLSAFCFQLR